MAHAAPEYRKPTFAQYRATHPGHWSLYGGTGLFEDWPNGRAPVGTILANNIVDNIVNRDLPEPNSWAVRTANLYVSTYDASVGLQRREAEALGERWEVAGGKSAIFRDWEAGDLRPAPGVWEFRAGRQGLQVRDQGRDGRLDRTLAIPGRRLDGRLGLGERATLTSGTGDHLRARRTRRIVPSRLRRFVAGEFCRAQRSSWSP